MQRPLNDAKADGAAATENGSAADVDGKFGAQEEESKEEQPKSTASNCDKNRMEEESKENLAASQSTTAKNGNGSGMFSFVKSIFSKRK